MNKPNGSHPTKIRSAQTQVCVAFKDQSGVKTNVSRDRFHGLQDLRPGFLSRCCVIEEEGEALSLKVRVAVCPRVLNAKTAREESSDHHRKGVSSNPRRAAGANSLEVAARPSPRVVVIKRDSFRFRFMGELRLP